MKNCINKRYKDSFASAFITAFKSPGVGIPCIRMAYGKTFEIVELRTSYRVTIRGEVRRYNNLFEAGEFIYDQNFDPLYIYVPPKTEKQKLGLGRKKKMLLRLFCSRFLGRNANEFLIHQAA